MTDPDEIAEALDTLHRAGWSVGDCAFHTETGGTVSVVT
jgi:hypothetical protein